MQTQLNGDEIIAGLGQKIGQQEVQIVILTTQIRMLQADLSRRVQVEQEAEAKKTTSTGEPIVEVGAESGSE